MSNQTIISVKNISKQYRLGVIDTNTIRGDLQRWWARVRKKEDPFLMISQVNELQNQSTASDRNKDYVWAIRDINFEVPKGEILGIIGKNGAGKSTLLKLLSRVTTPTTGEIRVKGRIASLLEVGTGFHPELTGRENIFLNGAILGMTKAEIKRKFDEIVDFAGVAKYIDTPVKRYSSGMYVRLAFAVAAHLEPEILIVDEVLAVGDADFQKKALGKMKDVSNKDGRTVLFVSHNMQAVSSLCNKGILLKNGTIDFHGDVSACVSNYLKGSSGLFNHKKAFDRPILCTAEFELLEIGVRARHKKYEDKIQLEDEIEFSAIYNQKSNRSEINLTLHLKDEFGNKIFSTGSGSLMGHNRSMGTFKVMTTFPANFFNWGSFSIDLFVIENSQRAILIENDLLTFTIENKPYEIGMWMGKEPGPLMPKFAWEKQAYHE